MGFLSQRQPLGQRETVDLRGMAQREESVDALGDVPFDQTAHGLVIDLVLIGIRDQRELRVPRSFN